MASLGRTRMSLPRGGTLAGTQRGSLRPFLVLFTISILLVIARDAVPVRAVAAAATQVLAPISRVVADGGAAAGRALGVITEIDRLRADNARLRTDNDRLALHNVLLREQAVAAGQAAKLDAAARGLPFESVPAQVIARDPSGVRNAIVLSVGRDHGVKTGHIVVGDTGVVGRISEVGTNFSKVLLLTDSGSTVSALAQGSRASGIVRGQYGDTLLMDWVLQSDPVKVGDVVITAGLALGAELRSYYPKGLVIGAVTAVEKSENAAYQRAVVAPAVDLRHLESALVVKTY